MKWELLKKQSFKIRRNLVWINKSIDKIIYGQKRQNTNHRKRGIDS